LTKETKAKRDREQKIRDLVHAAKGEGRR